MTFPEGENEGKASKLSSGPRLYNMDKVRHISKMENRPYSFMVYDDDSWVIVTETLEDILFALNGTYV